MTRLHARISLHNETFFYLIARIYFFGKCIAQQKKNLFRQAEREKNLQIFFVASLLQVFRAITKVIKILSKNSIFCTL
jgi:ABC-type oligopeptide transport system ATPase subunit